MTQTSYLLEPHPEHYTDVVRAEWQVAPILNCGEGAIGPWKTVGQHCGAYEAAEEFVRLRCEWSHIVDETAQHHVAVMATPTTFLHYVVRCHNELRVSATLNHA